MKEPQLFGTRPPSYAKKGRHIGESRYMACNKDETIEQPERLRILNA